METLTTLRVMALACRPRWSWSMHRLLDRIFGENHRFPEAPAFAAPGFAHIPSDASEHWQDNGLVLMAVPKRKTTHSRKRLRHNSKWLENIQHIGKCPTCGNAILFQRVCAHCLKTALKETAIMRRKEAGTYVEKRRDDDEAQSP